MTNQQKLLASAALALLFCIFLSLQQLQAAGGWLEKAPPGLPAAYFQSRRPIFYAGEPIVFRAQGAQSYVVRNYYGDIVDSGSAGAITFIKPLPPGWYKLYVGTRDTHSRLAGSTCFVVWRKDSCFPTLPRTRLSTGSYPSMDIPVRSLTGMGPDRLFVRDAGKPAESIKLLKEDIQLNKDFYLPFDPQRRRALMVAFSNGTTGKSDGVASVVSALQADVRYFEPVNEPNYKISGSAFATGAMKQFYDTVKSVDPALRVMGPGTVTIGPYMLPWLEDFFKAGGGKSIDVFSFHAYNTVNGDLFLARKALDSLNQLLARYGADKLEKWQTEQGYFAAMYGVYAPRHQGRWTMLQTMVYEQYGIPKEHDVYFYDRSHGFWDMPTWWENDDGGLNPAAALMRVWSEEVYGTNFTRAYNFGEAGNKLYLGSLFSGPGKQVAAFMSAGSTDGQVELIVNTGTKLHTVSAFGIEQDLPIRNGKATLCVPELPVYVELAKGQTLNVIPTNWGANLAREPGVKASASNPPDWNPLSAMQNNISKINNGDFENWYWSQSPGSEPWTVKKPSFPFSVELQLPQPKTIARVIVYAAPPWQAQGSLLDYELQYDKNGSWTTIDRISEPTKSFAAITQATRTTVDTYYSDRWIFQHHFLPIRTNRLRLLIHNSTWGGAATKEVFEAGGQASEQSIVIREIEAYAR